MKIRMTSTSLIPSGVLPQHGRIAVLAGSGSLPEIAANAIKAAGYAPLVIMIEGEAGDELRKYEHRIFPVTDISDCLRFMKDQNVTAVVMAGGVSSRPNLIDIKWSLDLLLGIPRIANALAKGDDGILRTVIGIVESRGIKVIGVHEIVSDIVVEQGAITRRKPGKSDWNDIGPAIAASRLLGTIDVGQAAVSVGGRVVALEGAEGTAAMLSRVADMRKNGRISSTKPGVLVKCLKPGQEMRVDMPAIGEDTVLQVKNAGLSGIVLEAGSTLVLDYRQTVAKADELKLFIFGHSLEPQE